MKKEGKGKESTDTFYNMIELSSSTSDFYSFWNNCDLISTYFSRMTSHNQKDSIRYSNLFSSVVNELLEVVFRTHQLDGRFICRVFRQGNNERIRITFPCSDEERRNYEEAIAQVRTAEKLERYVASLSGDAGPGRDVVLLELSLDYGAALRLEHPDDDSIAIIMDLPSESFS